MNISGEGFNVMLQELADLLANCTSFQTWVGAVEEEGEGEEEGRTAAEVAQDWIYAYAGPEPGSRSKYVIVDVGRWAARTQGMVTAAMAATNTSAFVVFQADVATGEGDSDSEALAAFMQDVGPIMVELTGKMALGGVRWPWTTCELSLGPMRDEKKSRALGQDQCQVVFEFGSELGA